MSYNVNPCIFLYIKLGTLGEGEKKKVYSPLGNIGRHCFSHFECLTRFVNRILDVLRCPGVIYLKAVSETSLGACAAHSHGLVYHCFPLFSSAELCTLFSLLHSDGGVNAVRLLVGF